MKKNLFRNFVSQSTFYFVEKREYLLSKMFDIFSSLYLKTLAKNRKPWKLDKESILQFPPNTLGYEVGNFLNYHGFELQSKAENHDVFHVLTSYLPVVKDEIGLQFLLLGNGKRSVFLYFALLGGILLLPEHWSFYIQSYQKGKSLQQFYNWEFEHLLHEDFNSLIQFINHNPYSLNLLI